MKSDDSFREEENHVQERYESVVVREIGLPLGLPFRFSG